MKLKKRQVNKIENLKKAYFNIGNNHYYEGYHIENKKWNGWAMPYFNKYIADLIAHNYSSRDFSITYNENDDCYLVITKDNGSITDEYTIKKLVIETEDGKKEVYDFASVGWTWDSYTIDELKSNPHAHIVYENKTIENIELEY